MFLYHRVPDRMVGQTLVPRTTLRTLAPELYEKYTAEYLGREHVLELTIKLLKCGWSDVIFLTAVHPVQLRSALTAEGHFPSPLRFYVINSEELKTESLAVQKYKGKKVIECPFRFKDLPEYEKIPEMTRRHYYEQYAWRKRPYLFYGIPHIFYKGTIDVSECAIIEV